MPPWPLQPPLVAVMSLIHSCCLIWAPPLPVFTTRIPLVSTQAETAVFTSPSFEILTEKPLTMLQIGLITAEQSPAWLMANRTYPPLKQPMTATKGARAASATTIIAFCRLTKEGFIMGWDESYCALLFLLIQF
ncbi:hypothetical protein DFH08DRAFT_835000 [Mycena albidolilacea]|uniref:Secreted protein n=1 Tax=Mycena albidolilacea TaxID=1033008 RepID=A0AAD7ARF0_9AGAR|nr:hypothetical protein DFH08DRAFT_835000 [Mycena albidolilacea]